MKSHFNKSVYPWLVSVRRNTTLALLSVFAVSLLGIGLLFSYLIVENSKRETLELSKAIGASIRSLMQNRDVKGLNSVFRDIHQQGDSISDIFLLGRESRVAVSSDPAHVGMRFDARTDPSCAVCHGPGAQRLERASFITWEQRVPVLRTVENQPNSPECHACHDGAQKYNGKLIIDRSAGGLLRPLLGAGLLIFVLGCAGLVLITRLLHHSFEQYLSSYLRQERQLHSLYSLLTQLSNTIDVEELRRLVVDILRETFSLERLDIVLPISAREWRWLSYVRNDGEGLRRKFPVPEAWAEHMEQWKTAKESTVFYEAGAGALILSAASEETPLAFFVMRKKGEAFEESEEMLARMMAEHIAASFKNAHLYHMAVTDDLTRLFARRHFDYCLRRDLQRAQQVGQDISLCMLDIDHFKSINDRHGHAVGDDVLREVAQRLSANLRSLDQAFRFGGEELAILSSNSTLESAVELAERIRSIMALEPFTGQRLRVTVSIGVTCSAGRTALTPRALFEEADSALYRAKRGGRNQVATIETPSPTIGSR